MKVINKKNKILVFVILIISLVFAFVIWQNNSIVISNYEYSSPKLPEEFEGFKIVHISDLHNKSFGKDQKRLLSNIEKLEPNIIVVTGDLIDRRKFDLEKAMSFIEGSVDIAPTYFVSGNHEAWSGEYPEIKRRLLESGVVVMDDRSIEISIGKSRIILSGLADPGFYNENGKRKINIENIEVFFSEGPQENDFIILLSHRPELFDIYYEHKIDLIFVGHAHGGQFRLPFIGAIFAPDQGFFPEFTSGSYNKGSSTMFVSRGLGNSIIPIRIFNRPEIIEVTFN